MRLTNLATLAALFGLSNVEAATGEYDYSQNGRDWPSKFADCAKTNQSPIDLSTNPSAYPRYTSADDSFTKIY